MKVLFLLPNYDSQIIHPPLGLGYLASYLIKNGHEVSIFDGTLKSAEIKEYLQEISDYQPSIVGISFLTRAHEQTRELVEAIKNFNPNLFVVLGGTQVTALPREIMLSFKADFAVLGEGEETVKELVDFIKEGKTNYSEIDGLAYRSKTGKIVVNKPRRLITDLDSLPPPAWDLMPPKSYRIVPILEPLKALPVAPIMTSRGCPYSCSFCASNVIWRRRIRFRSPENVIEEIKLLKEKYGVKEIHFADDNFTMDTKRAERICDLLIQEKIALPWQCPNGVRIDRLTLSLLRKMKASGCYAVGLGIESGNQRVLQINHKDLDLKIVPNILKNLKKEGIESYGFFILGLPGDTKQTIKDTINFALTNPFDRVWFNIFTPYPGSKSFIDWFGKRKFSEIDWYRHDCSTAVISLPDLSGKELERLQKISLLRFYLKPKNLYKFVSRLSFKEILSLMMSRFFSKISQPVFLFVHKTVRRKR